MKKKLLYIAVMVICLSLITGGTLAYYTASDTARNVITTGAIDVAVIEQQQLIDGTLHPFPDHPIPVMPATTVSKIVSVQGAGEDAWVRLKYTMTVYDADGSKLDIPAEELEKAIVIEPNTANWSEKDGWWYYSTPIAAGENTDPIFEEVAFSGPHMDNKYQRCTVVIDVTAQAVQQANNGKTVWEALGWPEN